MELLNEDCVYIDKEQGVQAQEPPVFRLIEMTGRVICMTPLYFELVAELLRSTPLGLWALMAGIIWMAKQTGGVPFALCSTALARKLEAATNNLTRSAHCGIWSTAKPITFPQPDMDAGATRKPSHRTATYQSATAKAHQWRSRLFLRRHHGKRVRSGRL